MRWDRLFDDLETQAAAEWEAEREALASEAERVRLARVELIERIRGLRDRGHASPPVRLELGAAGAVQGHVIAVGVDWFAIEQTEGRAAVSIVPIEALTAMRMPHSELLRSARPSAATELRDRVGWGFVLRDLARRRIPVSVVGRTGDVITGTIDRAGADHCDLAVHDLGAPRHPAAVTAFYLLPRTQIAAVRVEAADAGL